MIARISSTLLLAACALWPSALSAQWAAPGEYPATGYAPAPQYAPPSGPIQLANGYAPDASAEYYGDGSGYAAPVCPPDAMPWERDGDSPFRRFLKEVMPNTYFRLEYLSWDIDDIGGGGIGSDTLFATDLRRPIPFGVFDVDTFQGNDLLVADTEPITFNKLSGLRGTFGVPLTIGTFEVSAFGLEEGEAGIRNSIPDALRIQAFRVPNATALTVPIGVTSLTFPLDVTITPIPQTPLVIFSPAVVDPTTPPVPAVEITIPGDIILGNTTFNAATRNAIAIPLLQNGRPGLTTLIYDQAYSASYHNELWGGEAKLVLDYGPEVGGLSIKPLVGFRYMSFDEQFQQAGVSTLGTAILRNSNLLFVSSTPTLLPINQVGSVRGPAFVSTIGSEVQNTLYGLQVGTRSELNHKWFTLGVEPRISLGMNSYEAEVTTQNLRGPADGLVRTEDDDLVFAPVFDMTAYGRVHLSPYFLMHAGYNFTYLFRVTRPDDNIYYNDNGPNAPPGVVVNAETQDMHIQGLTIGGEFRFRDLKFR